MNTHDTRAQSCIAARRWEEIQVTLHMNREAKETIGRQREREGGGGGREEGREAMKKKREWKRSQMRRHGDVVASLYRGKRMLGPIPAARARKRVETLRDRHATLTKSAALLRYTLHKSISRRRKINGDRFDMIGTRGTRPWRRDVAYPPISISPFSPHSHGKSGVRMKLHFSEKSEKNEQNLDNLCNKKKRFV